MHKLNDERSHPISRRDFLRLSSTLAGMLALRYKPVLPAALTNTKPKVVHIHSAQATYWDFSTGWYGDYVDQDVIYNMVDQGVMRLTDTESPAKAWQTLLPNYVPGQRVAIKVNLVNADDEQDCDNRINALIAPVNGVLRGLLDIGVAASDIWVFDATSVIPRCFREGCDFPGVQFSGDEGANAQGFSAEEKVVFYPPSGIPSLDSLGISNVLLSADYLINMPVVKRHSGAGLSLGLKNHLGSIENCASLHDHIFLSKNTYTPDYNPMVEIYQNPHFAAKTILTIGDGLYGSLRDQFSAPDPWTTFGGYAPNSLFFSQDPVAVDCVMYDFLIAEVRISSSADDYLILASQEGLGVFEHRAPGVATPDAWYTLIDYDYVDLELGVPDATVIYHVPLTNTDTISHIFHISIVGNKWPVSVPATVGPVAAGGSTMLPVTVTAPAAAGATVLVDTVEITVTSMSTPTKLASMRLRTRAAPAGEDLLYRTYLPVVLRST